MGLLEAYYQEARYGGYSDVDGTVCFYQRVNALLAPSSVVLDVGCGRGAYVDDPVPVRRALRILKGRCATVIGLDPDAAAGVNPCVDEFRLLDGAVWPVDDASADLCLCDSVLEHVADPDGFFFQARRVLRLGGYLCLRTTNVLSYVGLAARIIPNRFHATITKRVQAARQEQDVFPVLYRCNTVWRVRRMLHHHGFEHCVYGYEAEPSYLSFSPFCFLLGVLHQRLAPRAFKVAIFGFARRTT